MMQSATAAALLGSFCGSLVECVEALTVVLAVGSVRGWRAAVSGAAGAVLVLAGIVAAFGPELALLELPPLRVLVGTLLLLFGLRWLRKAILRSAGVLPLHDEAGEFAKVRARLAAAGSARAVGLDRTAFAASFHIVMLEGAEVVFIVAAIGARHGPAGPALLLPAIVGAGSAALLVIALGLLLHRPLVRIPENALKFGVSVLLTSFGLYWIGEGFNLSWPGDDAALIGLVLGYGAVALALASLCRRCVGRRLATLVPEPARPPGSVPRPGARAGPLAATLRTGFALFVDDPVLAAGLLGWLALAGLFFGRLPEPLWRCALFATGPAVLLGYRTVRAATMV